MIIAKCFILLNIKDYRVSSQGGFVRREAPAQCNFESYGYHLSQMNDEAQSIICNPQTSGGLLVMISSSAQV
ncbi:hypothetical protein HUE58_02370 [Candidatus Ruthia endofausta]|uniref:Uncharacterized protein n=1 Tax=Candidatus Ruthia endofausta TaxID=2738852 RepID=A0A6N0HNR8_9GAMM|nr:hypothetical protein [Candidatus Ruthia endofausta]QKQ24029.1 hypothetical protein HUE58_02370 [Candidatus Ruthia endofausta]